MTTIAPATKLVVSSKLLRKALSFIGGAILSNPIVPILENVLCEVHDGVLTVTGSDLNTTLVDHVEVETDQNFSFCTPYKTLSNLLATFAEQPITFSLKPDSFNLSITSISGSYKLAGENPADYIRTDIEDESEHTTTLDSTDRVAFVSRISRLNFAVSTNDLAPHLLGLCWWGNEICTTDGGKKLSRMEQTVDVSTPDNHQYLIPSRVGNLLVNLSETAEPSESLHINLNRTFCLFRVGDRSILSTLIDPGVSFPDYKQIYPKEWALHWTMDRNALLMALRRVLTLTNMPTDTVVIEGLTEGKLFISVNDVDLEQQGKEILSAEIDGPLTIGFVGKVLLECLQNLSGDTMTMQLNAFNTAVKLTGDDDTASLLLFPVRI